MPHEVVQLRAVRIPIGDRARRHPRGHRCHRHRGRDLDDQAWIEGARDDVVGAEAAYLLTIGGGDDVALFDACQLGDRLHRRQLHLVGDGGRAHIQRTAEDEGEAQHVVDLIRIVRTPGGDERVIAHRLHRLGQDLRGRIGEREDHRPGRHPGHHLGLHHAARRQTEEDVRPFHDLAQLARIGRLRITRLDRVHQHRAAFVHHTFDIAHPDVLDRYTQLLEQAQAGERRRTGT